MRETLHQLTLTLALPIAVGAVWIARAERAEPPALEHATAYRVELADLPLPVRERLRTPGLAAPIPVARRAPEDSAPASEQPTLENSPRPAPVELAVESHSKRDVVSAPSPRAADEIAAPLTALQTPPPIAPAPLSLTSRSGTAPAAIVPVPASTAAPPVIVAATGTVKAASEATPAGADPNAWDRLSAIQAPLSRSPQLPGGRGAGAEPVAAPARAVGNSPIVTRDIGKSSPIAATPIATSDVGKPSPIASQPVEIGPGPAQILAHADGHAPLVPPGPLEDRWQDFSLPPESHGRSIAPAHFTLPLLPALPVLETADTKSGGHLLPPPVLEIAQMPASIDLASPDISEPAPAFAWATFRPTLVLVPEPGSAILLGTSLAALGVLRRSRRRV